MLKVPFRFNGGSIFHCVNEHDAFSGLIFHINPHAVRVPVVAHRAEAALKGDAHPLQ